MSEPASAPVVAQVFHWLGQLRIPAFALDLDGRVAGWNEAMATLTGISAGAMLGRLDAWTALSETPIPLTAKTLLAHVLEAQAQGRSLPDFLNEAGAFLLPANQRRCQLACDATVLRDAAGHVCGVMQLLQDVSDHEKSATRFRRLFAASPDPVWIIENNQFVDCNDAAVAMLGYASREILLNTHPSKLSPATQPDGMSSFEKAELMMAMATQNGLHRFEWVHTRADGSDFDAEVTLARLEVGGNHAIYCTWRDITERKRAEAQVRLYASVFQHSGEGILITDADNRIVAINPALQTQTGYSAEEVLGRNPHMFSAGRTPKKVYEELWESLNRERFWQGELWDRRKDGSVFAKWAVISANTDAAGRVLNYIAAYSDISQRKEAEARIDWMAHHDALTGLLNRHGFAAHIEQSIANAQRHERALALVFLDLDRFKLINDTLGHHVGDLLLAEVAKRLKDVLRETDAVARLGGDEFVMLISDLDSALQAMPVLRKLELALSEPYLLEGRALHLTPSMGVALYPDDADGGAALMRQADTAMYHAKDSGRNNTQFYAVEMTTRAAERLELERDLWKALDESQFVLHYQPQVCTRTGQVSGAEALVRWQHPQRGMVSPIEFIGVAEESGAIQRLGAWVLDEACRQMQLWRNAGVAPGRIAVNVSAHQLRQQGFFERVQQTLTRHALPPSVLTLEITESAAMERPEQAILLLRVLREMGIEIAIDDFGTGYSSLAYLQALPIQCLKLDRSFVRNICEKPGDAAIAAASIALAHKLDLQVVAEGVETAAQQAMLVAQGCDYLQGYRFARPIPAVEWPGVWQGLQAWSEGG